MLQQDLYRLKSKHQKYYRYLKKSFIISCPIYDYHKYCIEVLKHGPQNSNLGQVSQLKTVSPTKMESTVRVKQIALDKRIHNSKGIQNNQPFPDK